MSSSELRLLTTLAEIDAATAGNITGAIVATVLPLAGALKCMRISRRPATNRKCALALMFLLLGWAMLSFAGLMTKMFPKEWYLALILGLPACALILTGFVLAIIGLIEFGQQPGVFTQGRAQAIWTLVLSVLILSLFVGGAVVGARRGLAKNTQPASGERLRFEEYNFQFRAPGKPWVQTEISRLNRFAKLGFLRTRPEVYFIIIPEKLPGSFTTDQLAEVALTHMRSAAEDVRVLKKAPEGAGGLSGLRLEIETQMAGQSFFYINWVCVTNGWAYQILSWGRVLDRKRILDEFSPMRERFSLIDPWRTAPRGGQSPKSDHAVPNWGFTFRWKESDWRPYQELASQLPMATFGAEHLDNGAMMIASIWLMGLEPHDAIVHQGLLNTFGFQMGSDTPIEQREIQQGRFSGIEVLWRRRPDKGEEYTYQARVLRGDGHAHFVVAWVDSKHPNGMTLLKDAFSRLEFAQSPQPAPDPSQFDGAENRTHRLALNSIGLAYYQARQFDRSAAFFQAALKCGRGQPESPILANLVLALRATGKNREALDAVEQHPEMVKSQVNLQAERAYLLGELGESEAALTDYARLFSSDYRDDTHFKDYADLLAQVHHPTNALAEVEKYVQTRDSIEVRLLQAHLCRRVKEFDKAITLLQTQRLKHPFDAPLAFGLAEAYLDATRYTDALALSQEMTKNGGDSAYAYYLCGRSQIGLKWYREAKDSFELAAKKAPADAQVKAYLDLVSGLLGEGANTALKTVIQPVVIPALLLSNPPAPPTGYAKEHGAYYNRRVTALSFAKGKELKTTEFMEVRTLTPAGVSAFSSFQVAFDPLAEEIFINRLEVHDNAGQLVSTGRVADYYLVDDTSTQMATQKKIANIPVAGLQPGYSVELTVTRRELGRAEEFTFLPHTFSGAFPARIVSLFLSGDTGAVRFATSPEIPPLNLSEGLCWQVKEPPVYRWEPMQPSLVEFLPTVWVADNGARWPSLATNYLKSIHHRLELSPAQRDIARKLVGGLDSDAKKIAAIAGHIQTNYTYKAIEFGRRARIPLAVEDIVRNRYGDCKDHALLAQQMLSAVGIPAFLALVNSREPLRSDLPSLDQFDHMIVHIPDAGGGIFLDCTDKASDLPAAVPAGLAEQESLILDERNPRLAHIPAYTTNASVIRSVRQVEATNSSDALVQEMVILSGIHGSYLRALLRGQTPTAQRSTILSYLKPAGTDLTLFETDNLESSRAPLVLRLNYALKGYFHQVGKDSVCGLPSFFEQAYLRTEAREKRDSPFQIMVPLIMESTVILLVPLNDKLKSYPDPARQNTRFVRCAMDVSAKARQLEARFTANIQPGRFKPSDYPEYHASLERALDLFSRNVVLEREGTKVR